MDKKTRQQIALFRHGLIGDLVHRKVGERGLYALLRDKAERVYEIPGVVFYIESRRFLIRDSPRPATTYEQKTGGADGVKGA